jgi:hypothetical protein
LRGKYLFGQKKTLFKNDRLKNLGKNFTFCNLSNGPSAAKLLLEIGLCLHDPTYGDPNYVGASLYFRQASALGDGISSFIFHYYYLCGHGFTKSIPEALK